MTIIVTSPRSPRSTAIGDLNKIYDPEQFAEALEQVQEVADRIDTGAFDASVAQAQFNADRAEEAEAASEASEANAKESETNAEAAANAALIYADIDYRVTHAADLPGGQPDGTTAIVSGSNYDSEDGVYEVQGGSWVRVGDLGTANKANRSELDQKADKDDLDNLQKIAIAAVRQEYDGVIPDRPYAEIVNWYCWDDPTASMDARYDSWFLVQQPDIATMPTPSEIATFDLTPLGGNEIQFELTEDVQITPPLLYMRVQPQNSTVWQSLDIAQAGDTDVITGLDTGYNKVRVAYVNAGGYGDYAFMEVMSQDVGWFDDFRYEMGSYELNARPGYVSADGVQSLQWIPADEHGPGGYAPWLGRNSQNALRMDPAVTLVGRTEGWSQLRVLNPSDGPTPRPRLRIGVGRITSDGEWFEVDGRAWRYYHNFNQQAGGTLDYDVHTVQHWYSPTQVRVILNGSVEIYSAAMWEANYQMHGPFFAFERQSGMSDTDAFRHRLLDFTWRDEVWT